MIYIKRTLSVLCSLVLIYSILLPGAQAFAQTDAPSINTSKAQFSDIQNHWAKSSIEELIELEIIEGFEDGTFRPQNEVTKAQFVAMITRLLGLDSENSDASFSDVPTSHWAYEAVEVALEQNIIDPKEKFYPDKVISREEMAVMIAKALELQPVHVKEINFKDKKAISNGPLVAAVVKLGLLEGYEDQTFKPEGNLTRAESSVVLVRMELFLEGVFLKDIENHWAEEDIKRLVDMGIIEGYEDHTFRPSNEVTRVQFVTMLVRLMGYEMEYTKPYFKDIQSSHWAFSQVQAAVENRIIDPEEYQNTLSPDEKLTRQEMTILMARTLRLTSADEAELPFADKNKITKEVGLIATAIHEGLINGFEDHTFRPAESSTRGQAATILSRLYNYSMNSDDPNVPTAFPISDSEDQISLLDSVIEMPEEITASLEEVKNGDSTFIFSKDAAEVQSLKVGDIFILAPSDEYPSGFAEKVKSISTSNGKTTVRTEDPDLAEVFEEIDVQEVTDVTFDKLIPIDIPEGVSFEPYYGGADIVGASDHIGEQSFQAAAKQGDFKLRLKDPLEFKVKDHTVKVSGGVAFTDTKVVTKVGYKRGKLNSLENLVYMNPVVTVNVAVPKTIASGKIEGTYSKVFKGMHFEAKAPKFLNGLDSTEPFERRKSIGTFYLPVYGPVGANLEAFLVVKADLTVGIELEIVEKVKTTSGIIAYKGGLERVRKFQPTMPEITVTGEGGIQAQAGVGAGIKLSIYKLSVGGVEVETGLKGSAYARATLGKGDSDNPNRIDDKFQVSACYRIGFSGYVGAYLTIDALELLGLDARWNLMDDKEKKFAEKTNCSESQLLLNPDAIILTPGSSERIHLEYFTFDKEEFDLQNKTDQIMKEDIAYKIDADEDIKVIQNSSNGRHFFDIAASPNVSGEKFAELEVLYKEGSQEIKAKVPVIVTSFEDIEVDPDYLVLGADETKKLITKEVYKQIDGINVDSILEEGKKKEDLFKKVIKDTDAIKYKSLDTGVATVDANGLVKGKSSAQGGETQIEVSYKGKKATVPVTVMPRAYSEPRSGGSSVNPRLEMFRDIILESEKHALEAYKPEAESDYPAHFDDLKPMLMDFYTDHYLDEHWKKVYDHNIKWFLDPHLLFPLTEATKEGTGNTFTITSDTSNKVKATVLVPLRDNEIKGDRFKYEYILINTEDRWKLDDLSCLSCERPE